jgi:hypothetical protein
MRHARTAGWATIAIGLAFGLAACGAAETGSTAPEGATPAPDAPATQDPGTAPEASVAPDAPPPAEDPGSLNTAVVTIGDERYEFTDVQCSIFAPRYIQAGNFGGDPEVSIVLPPDGWESEGDTYSPPSVRVQIGDEATGQRWVAGDDGFPRITPLPDGASQIDSYTVPEGRPVTATGTGTFVDLVAHNSGAEAPSVSGSFEVSCP